MSAWADEARLRMANIPKRFWTRKITLPEQLEEYVRSLGTVMDDNSSPDFGQGLVIGGAQASEWGCGVLKEAILQGYTARFIDFMYLIEAHKRLISEYDTDLAAELLQIVTDPQILLIDMVSPTTEYQSDTLYRICKTRYDAGKPTILTGSLSLSHALGERFQFDQAAWLTK